MSKNNSELSFKKVVEKYPDFPRVIIRKIDTALRGVKLTDKALEKARQENALFDASGDLGEKGPKDRKSTRLNSSHIQKSRMPSSA